MSTLTVWKFDDPAGAQQAEEKLVALSKEHLITVLDAAIVTWEEGKKKPKTRQANNLAAAGALGGACLLYTSDAADDLPCVDLGGRRIIKQNR